MSESAVRIGDNTILINGSCRKCDFGFSLLLPSNYPSGGELFDSITKTGKDDWTCDLPDDFLPPDYDENQVWADDHDFVPQAQVEPLAPINPVVESATNKYTNYPTYVKLSS